MILEYAKGSDVQLSEHFHLKDFDCHCKFKECRTTYVDEELVDALEKMREYLPTMWIESAFRCTAHNKAIGGKPGSIHLLGKAADVHAAGFDGGKVAAVAENIEAFRKGAVGRAKNYAHLDTRGYKVRFVY